MMTYNWDNMVEITVPKGTNGWVYSGEVTINGVNVKFPVGTPTTVPEPAAALLNKMIELEREDDLSGAKPNNHYVGNVTVPDGKTLTLQKGAKVVDEAGVLGSGGGNAGGGGMMVITGNILELFEENIYRLSCGESYGEVYRKAKSALEANIPMVFDVQNAMGDEGTLRFALVSYYEESFLFGLFLNGYSFSVSLHEDDCFFETLTPNASTDKE